MARITSDLFEVTEFAHHCPEEFFIAGIKIVIPFIILMGASPRSRSSSLPCCR